MLLLRELQNRTLKQLAELESGGLTRRLRPRFGIDLCSNDYLGLSNHPQLKERMADTIHRLGCGSTASRLLRGEVEDFARAERAFARFKKTESALFFSSGYAANIGVLASFLQRGDLVFSDRLNHASIIDALRLSRATTTIFPHSDADALYRAIRNTPCAGQRFLVTESVFSMDGDEAPLRDYAQICRETDTALIVDEAHAVGVFGSNGSGLIEELGIDCFISINTAGKALGVMGAFVAGPSWAIEYLIQRARTFIFSTAPPPAVAAALELAIELIEQNPEMRRELLQRAALVRSSLQELGLSVPTGRSQIVPVILGDVEAALRAAEYFQSKGFDVRAIRPPTVPAGTSRLRISVNLNVRLGELHDFLNAAGQLHNL